MRMNCLILFVLFACSVAKIFGDQCKCGVESSQGRIVGGTEVTSASLYPWMAMITDADGVQFCAGTLVSSKAVITAAHCTENEHNSTINVAIGLLKRSGARSIQRYGVSEIVNHEYYNSTTLDNDIAILILDREVNLTTIPPICLPAASQSAPYSNLRVIGWGVLRDSSNQASENLMEVDVPETPFDSCNRYWSNSLKQNQQICAGDNGKDSCQGDSGGPLFSRMSGRNYHVGIVSFGGACGTPNAVYTHIPGYRDWIDDNLRDHSGGHRCL